MDKENNNNLGTVNIELYQTKGEKLYNWGRIEYTPATVLISMYECGEVARTLFYLNKSQVKQLSNTLAILAETMEE